MRFEVDTSSVPLADRFDYWSTAASDVIHPMRLHRDDPRRFAGRMRVSHLGGIDIWHIAGDSLTVVRTPELIRSNDPEQLNLVDLVRGSCSVRQEGRRGVMHAGDLCGHATSLPYTYAAETAFELVLFGIPRVMLGPQADRICAATATTIPSSSEVARICRSFLRNLAAGAESGRLGAAEHGLSGCLPGVVHSLYCGLEGADPGRPSDELFEQVLAHIDARLTDRDLGPRSIADAHFISVRYLHKLFNAHDLTVASHIRARRLERCRSELADPRNAQASIGQIARHWGLADAPTFSRQFRRAFGVSPREYRAAAGG
jgi:AraC-like DNA-binding protein